MSFQSKLSERDRAVLNSIFNPSLSLGEDVYENEISNDDSDDDSEQDDDLKQLEIQAVRFAENKEYEKSLNVLEQVMVLSPNRPAAYNNRAQVYRLMGNIDAAFSDLTEALKFSDKNGKAYKQALCQRGLLHRKLGRDDEARRDFQEAAKLGSPFAKQQLTELNPYAALCNQMLSQVMHKLD
ncbi:tetratricopeptide repeat protein 36 [Arctopsyche grandis]|uniref:tetratricopeptide repeat protein 36 n=1 Tax=Arctopsyche grandis TaxID=121162 RepID=UPI00406D937B